MSGKAKDPLSTTSFNIASNAAVKETGIQTKRKIYNQKNLVICRLYNDNVQNKRKFKNVFGKFGKSANNKRLWWSVIVKQR